MYRSGDEQEVSIGPASILVVDDHPANLTAARAVLEPLGQEIVAVSSGEQALVELSARKFVVALLDVNMPGMTGLDLARTIRETNHQNASLPIIFLTAMETDTAQIRDAYATGAVDYVHKPIEPDILRSKVATFVDLYRTGQQLAREIAARAEIEAARAAAEQSNREKDEFLAILSHELRTPLTAILIRCHVLLSGSSDPTAIERGLRMIEHSAQREAYIIDNVIEMGRLATSSVVMDMGMVDVAAVLREVVDRVSWNAGQQNIALAVTIAPEPAKVWGDGQRLRQALFNVVSNAVKFTPPAGRIDIRLEREPAHVVVRVIDTGIGFSAEVAARLFEKFKQADSSSTRPYGGLGLGLAVARHIVELHGGTIRAHSAGPAQGAAVTVTLPCASPA
jgi:signal transduction histidine kinase